MGLLDDVGQSVNDVLTELFADDSLIRPVIYRKFVSRDYDSEKGHTVPVYREYPVDAIRLRHTTDSVQLEHSSVEVGDWYYMFRSTDLPSNLSMSDSIMDGGTKLSLKSINNGFNFVHLITVTGLGL